MKNAHTLSALVCAIAVLTACGTPPKHPLLEEARSGYRTAQSDLHVTKLAAVELQEAGKALQDAEHAHNEGEDKEVVDHLALVAKQRVLIAQETAKQKTTEAEVADADLEREKVRLEMRTAEAEAAKQKAAAAQAASQQLNEQLTAAKQQAELAQQSSTQKATELEAVNAKLKQMEAEEAEAAKQKAAAAQAASQQLNEQLTAAKQQAELAQQSSTQKAAELEAVNAKLKQMETELNELNAKKTERGMVITLGDVLFDTNKSQLKAGGIRSLEKLAAFFKEYPERKALIEGFTDSTGSEDHNQQLSEQRANAVRTALVDMGIGSERLSTRGYGESFPVASNDTAAGRQLNRRVEIILSDDQGNVKSR